jgi:hypothetical protein
MTGNQKRINQMKLGKVKDVEPDEWLNIPIPLCDCIRIFKKDLIEKSVTQRQI